MALSPPLSKHVDMVKEIASTEHCVLQDTCLAWCTVKVLRISTFLRRAPKRFYYFWDAIPLNDTCYWSHKWLRYRILANRLYLMRFDNFHVRDISPGISETKFMPSSLRHFFVQSKLNLSECLFPFRLDLLRKKNSCCWFRWVFVVYYWIESNLTMKPTPHFPRSNITIIKVSGTNASLSLCRWSESTLRCSSCPNLKEFK